jgi:putative protein kinase ArgK-like GTPase of G3E family
VDTVNKHLQHLKKSGGLATRNRTRLSDELHTVLQEELVRRLLAQLPAEYLSKTIDELSAKKLTPFEAAQKILASEYVD